MVNSMSVAHGSKEALRKRKKRKYELGSSPTKTKVGEKDGKRNDKGRGGNVKVRVSTANKVNLLDPEKGEYEVTEVRDVKENPSNRNYARENVITKGAIIETSEGEARVTSRPGQDGTVNAVLVTEEE